VIPAEIEKETFMERIQPNIAEYLTNKKYVQHVQ
jgi:hypothetical protein